MQPPPSPRSATGAPHDTLSDAGWLGEAWYAIGCAALLLGASLLVDAVANGLTLLRMTGWITLATALLVILLPARVSAGPGHLTVRGLWVTKSVRTDRLSAVDWPVGIAQRLVLTDADGVRAEVDLRVLTSNPALWLRLEADARAALERGTLDRGAASLARLSLRVDADTTRSVFNVSGLS
ncbi:hypothetical protein GCM10022244_12370 [Streptomyces gulbargensis]|uniref:Integral membrane protein n=1 Tax=Streptomyces gulbargensis TaxID=364901 RepID=A0ABP7LKI7_9ACTN